MRMLNKRDRIYEKLNEGSGVYFNGTLVEFRQTPYQRLEIWDTPELGRIFRLDGFNMTSERDEFFYHENLVHPALCAHPAPKSALVIGGGDGGSAEEILKHSTIEMCHLVELDGEVIAVAKEHFAKVHGGVFDNPKLKVTVGDGLAYLKSPSRHYDLIALDLTDPVGPAVELYSAAFFEDCRKALTADGALVLHVGSPVAHAERVRWSMNNLRKVFPIAQPYFVHIPLYGSVWGFVCASLSLDAARVPPDAIDARLAERNVQGRQYYNGQVHRALFALPEYIKPLVR
jgi:spermidine synthase